MNTERTVSSDAVPPAAIDSAQPGMSRLKIQPVHMAKGWEDAGAPSVLDPSIEVMDITRLGQEISHLAAQNDRLLKSVDTLLSLHESEKAQRLSMQATLDRLLEEAKDPAPKRLLETVGAELRNGVSEDLKPLLHAIIELLELSARREPSRPAETPEINEITVAATSGDNLATHNSAPSPPSPEDLPSALPEILTKSVEELVGKRRDGRARTPKPKKNHVGGSEQHTVFKASGPHAWIPVTSGALKP